MHSSRPWAAIRHYILALAGYALVALLVMAPVLLQFTTAIPGGMVAAVDGWQNVWGLWWAGRALAVGRNPFFSDMIFFPQGAPLYLQTLGLSNGVLVLPVTLLWGPEAAYNAAALLGLALSGMAGYALALEVSSHRRASFLAGLIFTCSPYHLSRVYDGQLELISLQWPTFYALFLLRALARRRRRDTLLAGVCLALTGYTSLYYLVFMILFSLAAVILWPSVRGRIRPALAVGLTGLLLLLPLLLPAMATAVGRNGAVFRAGAEEVLGRSANLLDFGLPSYLHPLWGQALFAAVGRAWHDYSGDWNAALGYGVLALAALGARANWRAAWRWWAIVGVALLFALGPQLQIGAWRSGMPLPYALLDALPGLSLGRRPQLFVALATIALVPPLALGLRALDAWAVRRRRPWLLPVLLAALAFELLPRPLPVLSAAVHPYYRQLVGRPGALLEIPPARYKYSLPQLAQTVHGRPIFGGYLARPPVYAVVDEAPALHTLWQMRLPDGPPLLADMTDPLVPLSYYGVGDVLVHWDRVEPARRAEVEAALALALPGVMPEYADTTISVYHLPAVAPRPFAGLVGPGWHPSEGDGARNWRWMRDEGRILLVNPTDHALPITLGLRAQGYHGPRHVRLTLDDADAGAWDVGAGETTAALRLWLAPGAHHLVLTAQAVPEQISNSGRMISIALLEAQIIAPPSRAAP